MREISVKFTNFEGSYIEKMLKEKNGKRKRTKDID